MNLHAKAEFIEAVLNREPVAGLTHGFYRYPARFSPQFVRAALKAFTQPGDIVLDPFMGGGTTLVEARLMGRRAIRFPVVMEKFLAPRGEHPAVSPHHPSRLSLHASCSLGSLPC